MRPALVGLGCLAVLLALAGLPPSGEMCPAVLGGGDRLPDGLWSLWYGASRFWTDGLRTSVVLFPQGGRIWPDALPEAVLFAPVTRAFGVEVAWNTLHFVRIFAGGAGAAVLVGRLGAHPAWGALVALAPAVLQGIGNGWVEAGAMAWMPWAAVLLLEGGWARGLAAGLLMTTAPATAAAALLALAVLRPDRIRSIATATALVPVALAWGLQAWTLLPGEALREEAARAFVGQVPAGEMGAGSLVGLVGMGEGAAWGGPVLLLAGLGFRRSEKKTSDATARRGAWLAILGAVLALGSVLSFDEGAPISLGTRLVPLPLILVERFPPVSLLDDAARLGVLAWLGTAVVLGRLAVGRPWALPAGLAAFLACLLLSSAAPGWTRPPPPPDPAPEGPILVYPLERVRWSLHAQAHHGQAISTGIGTSGPDGYESLVSGPSWTAAALQQWARAAGFRTLLVDARAGRAQAEELVHVLGAQVVAVDGPGWAPVQLRGHRFEAAAPVPPLPDDLRPPPEDWTDVDPDVSALLDPDLFDRAATRVWVFESDGQSWTRGPAPVAHSLTSLGLGVAPGEAALVIVGLVELTHGVGQALADRHPAAVAAVTTPDLERWGARQYWLDQPRVVVDPQVDFEPDGRAVLTAWTTDRLGVDPVLIPGDHEVVRASAGAGGRFAFGPPVFAAPRLADPTPCGDFLYLTQLSFGERVETRVVVTRREGTGYREVGSVPDISVPYVWREGEAFRMVAHRDAPRPLDRVVELRSEDGIAWSEPVAVPLDGIASCESPVAARFRGRTVLVCSERIGGR